MQKVEGRVLMNPNSRTYQDLAVDVEVCQHNRCVTCCKTECEKFLGCPMVQNFLVSTAAGELVLVGLESYRRPRHPYHPSKNGKVKTYRVVTQEC